MRSHLAILDHFKETSPNECSAQKIFNVVDVFNEEL